MGSGRKNAHARVQNKRAGTQPSAKYTPEAGTTARYSAECSHPCVSKCGAVSKCGWTDVWSRVRPLRSSCAPDAPPYLEIGEGVGGSDVAASACAGGDTTRDCLDHASGDATIGTGPAAGQAHGYRKNKHTRVFVAVKSERISMEERD